MKKIAATLCYTCRSSFKILQSPVHPLTRTVLHNRTFYRLPSSKQIASPACHIFDTHQPCDQIIPTTTCSINSNFFSTYSKHLPAYHKYINHFIPFVVYHSKTIMILLMHTTPTIPVPLYIHNYPASCTLPPNHPPNTPLLTILSSKPLKSTYGQPVHALAPVRCCYMKLFECEAVNWLMEENNRRQ